MAIQDALDQLMRDTQKTAFVIAQRVSTVRDADLILVLDDGKIVASGRHEELMATSRALQRHPRLAAHRQQNGRDRRESREVGLMRWQGSLEVMASQDEKRARNRAATARRLVGELAPWKSMLFAALGYVLVNAGAQAAGPWLVGRTIDRAIALRQSAAAHAHDRPHARRLRRRRAGAARANAPRRHDRPAPLGVAARAAVRAVAGAAAGLVRQAAGRRSDEPPSRPTSTRSISCSRKV